MKNGLSILISIIFTAFSAGSAHLEPGSLSSPKAGMKYAVGAKVNFTWIQAQYHRGSYSFAYSKNGGTSWENIATWEGPGGDNATINYSWTVPNAPSTQTKVRICQLSKCTDPDYVLTSGNFTIEAGGTFLQDRSRIAPTSLRFLSDTRNLEVTFSLDRTETVSLQVFDTRGRLLATLLDGEHAAGAHEYSLSSKSLKGAECHGALHFKLTTGNRVFTESWNALP